MEKKASKVVVGSKGVALTTEAVYNVSRGSVVELDSSTLDRIAHNKSSTVLPGVPGGFGNAVNSGRLHVVQETESRATLVVVLHKLLQGSHSIRTFLPLFITEVLNSGISSKLGESPMDFDYGFSGSAEALVKIIYMIREDVEPLDEGDKNFKSEKKVSSVSVVSSIKTALVKAEAGEIGVTNEELGALESCFAVSVGVAALASDALNSLTVVADAFAALSCEALQVDTAPFESPSFKQTFIYKPEADVVTDLNSLLFGSKLVKARKGGVDAEFVQSIPASHGALRDAVKLLASRLIVEINRVDYVHERKTIFPGSSAIPATSSSSSPSLFTTTLLSLFVSLWPIIRGSSDRTSRSIEFIRDLNPKGDAAGVPDWDSEADPYLGIQNEAALLGMQNEAAGAASAGDNIFLARKILSALETWKVSLATECAAALALLSIRERISAGRDAGQDGGQGKGNSEEGRAKSAGAGGKSTKQRKNFVLGKGTALVRQSLACYIDAPVDEYFATSDTSSMVEKKLGALLNRDVPEFDALVAEVKNVLESNEIRRLPKIAKGTRDFKPEQMAIREKAFGIIASIFKRHGAVALDTPVFELRETLMGKYGEDSKLIYDLADQGGEMLSLRYDLTVPFARYLAMNKVENLKRYHIAKVYRRDNPAKGRYREFYQCDLDIAGHYAPMVPDFEVLKVLTELLNKLDIGEYKVKLNHRKILDGMLDICGVPQAKFRSICSAIDKLDKLPWEQVRKEMVEEKGLTSETADAIGKLVQKKGQPLVLLEELKQTGSPFLHHADAYAALEDLGILFEYLKAAKCIDQIVFDLSLARGLDYYTGVIYEAVFKGATQVGSIAAGGRYDNLVGMFSGKQVPAVGVSVGIERVFAIMEQQEVDKKRVMRTNQTEVLLVVLGNNVKMTKVAVEIVTDLWEGELNAEFKCVANAKLAVQITNAATSGIPWVVIVGDDEIKAGIVRLRNIADKTQEDVKRENLVAELQRRLRVVAELPYVP